MQLTEKKLALTFKALGDENRIRILKNLREGEICACKLLEALKISQPTLSHHMKILCDADIVIGRREGIWVYYSICTEGSQVVKECLNELLSVNYNGENGVSEPCCKE